MSNIKDKLSASVRQSQTGNKPVAPRNAGAAAPSQQAAAAPKPEPKPEPIKPATAAPLAAKKAAGHAAPDGFSAPGRVWPD